MKKGEITWDTIVKLVLGVAILLIVILILWYIKAKLYGDDGNTVVSNLAKIIRFGK